MRLDAGAGAGCNAAPLPSCRAPMSLLFSPISFGPLQLPNRIVIAPMCQYSAHDGCVSDWHHIHLAYRTENAIYLYVHQTQAYLWNDSLDAGWEALKAHLPADRLRDLR